MKSVYINICLLLFAFIPMGIHAKIKISDKPVAMEVYAAQELQRYFYHLTGELLAIDSVSNNAGNAKFVLAFKGNSLNDKLESQFPVLKGSIGDQGYILQTVKNKGKRQLVICGGSETGLLYGIYGLLEDHYGVAFYYSGDVLPEKKVSSSLKDISDRKEPEVSIRGMLPWTNFPQSATIYSWADWKFIIDQTAKMRMNFILVHNYNGMAGHNEMFHNFEYKGLLSRVWMPTVKTGHGWLCPGWDQKEYLFGGSDLYDDYDFGADCALHNEYLSNKQVFAKGVSLFQRVLMYAHTRGVKIGLGLDIDLIPDEYKAQPFDPVLVKARVEQITSDYPTLDYLFCFQSENPDKDEAFYTRWNKTFDEFYQGIKNRKLQTKIAVSGWGLTAESVSHLPADVICAPISHYSASCENGEIYGDREYWGCPWLERDFNSSQYYYPYNVDLSETIKAFENRAKNMKGFYSLTWRLTDAVEPKIWYISKAPWRTDLKSSETVYYQYAQSNYGKLAAKDIAEIINQNEAFATDFGECQQTPKFDEKVYTYSLMNILDFKLKNHSGEQSFEAISFSAENGTKNAETRNNRVCVAFIEEGDWLKFEKVDFQNLPTEFIGQFASASNGGVAKIRIDAPDGPEIGEIRVKNTEGWHAWKEHCVALANVKGVHDLYITFHAIRDFLPMPEKAQNQVDKVVSCINNPQLTPVQKYRLGLLKYRLQGVKYHIELNKNFESYKWEDFPSCLPQWVESFADRITDISTFGNIQSIESRFIQQNYVSRLNELYKLQQVKAPYNLVARGTPDGAVLEWVDMNYDTRLFEIFRNGEKIGEVAGDKNTYVDKFDGKARYSVAAVDTDGKKSLPSVYTECLAGNADKSAPIIIAVSTPTSHFAGEPLGFKVVLKDNRTSHSTSVKLHYRKLGSNDWKTVNMTNKIKYTFTVDIPENDLESSLEYYISATDGSQTSVFPVTAPTLNKSILVYSLLPARVMPVPVVLNAGDKYISWNCAQKANIHQYKIYRSSKADFDVSASNFVTYVSNLNNSYRDYPKNFDGGTLKGNYYYKVTSVDIYGNESKSSKARLINYD